MGRILLVYEASCPNCGGRITSDRLERGLVCHTCLPHDLHIEGKDWTSVVEYLGKILRSHGKLLGYWELYEGVERLREFEAFFRRVTGFGLWSAQRSWARRLLCGESLAIVAPTGVGKTTLLAVYSIYAAAQGSKVYYLLPTENLVEQVAARLRGYAERANTGISVVSYHSRMPVQARRDALAAIEARDYDVLVTTTGFLSRRWNLLEGVHFDLVAVDDVDAMLRNSRNIDRVLLLLGFTREAIDYALKAVKYKIEASIAKASGRVSAYERAVKRLAEVEEALARELEKLVIGQLVIASATGRAYGIKPRIFRELLGFDVGRVYDHTRSISNLVLETSSVSDSVVKVVADLVSRGLSGLVFVSQRYGKKYAKKLVEELTRSGVRARTAFTGSRALDSFERGEVDVLVGVASYYGVIVRGIDLPHRVYFTVFMGVPARSLSFEKALLSPYRLARAALELGVEGAQELARTLSRLTPSEAMALRIALENGEQLSGKLAEALSLARTVYDEVVERVRELVKGQGQLTIAGGLALYEDDSLVLIVPDAATYLQASGRASRMYGSAMTHGISVVVETRGELIELLRRKLRKFLGRDAIFYPYEEKYLEDAVRRAVESRRSRGGSGRVDIETCLIVVESPTKAKTIARFFGKPVRRRVGSLVAYETTFRNPVNGKVYVATIVASRGHIYDLTVDDVGLHGVIVDNSVVAPVYTTIKQCRECGHQFASNKRVCPRCGSDRVEDKYAVVEALRKLAQEVDTVYIATDPDIEGEKIAYDIALMLRPYTPNILRIELHEITREELYRALASPRTINRRVVEAQVVRRIEDRWIGFGLSQHLWNTFGMNWLGAGRVQTPVLGWIVRRYEEWRRNLGYNVLIVLSDNVKLVLHARTREEAEEIARIAQEEGVTVVSMERERVTLNPPPPYTTEELIYDASRLLGYTSEKTMRIAQELYETGLITYHRTDTCYVSNLGISIAKTYLSEHNLDSIFQPRHWGEPGHHEAIRPTRPWDVETLRRAIAMGEFKPQTTLRESHYRLYNLVFRRFLASQCKPAEAVSVRLVLSVNGKTTTVEVLERYIERGFTTFYETMVLAPNLVAEAEKGVVKPLRVKVYRGSTVKLYRHGDVVLMMKQRGLGRPSTYAKIVEALKRHGYVIESKYRKYLVPTKLGVKVYQYLVERFSELVSEERTRQLLSRIDAVVHGEADAYTLILELEAELESLLRGVHYKLSEEAVEAS